MFQPPSILTGTVQIRGHRVGIGTSTDASANYGNINPRMGWTSWRRPTTLAFPTIAQDNKPEYWGLRHERSAHPATGMTSATTSPIWHTARGCIPKSHFKWNDLGDNNGFIRMSYKQQGLYRHLVEGRHDRHQVQCWTRDPQRAASSWHPEYQRHGHKPVLRCLVQQVVY